jgi:transposase
VLDLSWVHAELAPYYPKIGRPSIDPVLMIRMLVVGYTFAIRSERMLCREVQVNLAYRWFCGLSIEDKVPDHSAFSRARNERFRDSDIFRQVFERVVEACVAAGLVGGEGFAVDASLIAADTNKQRSIPGKDWDKNRAPERASRAVKEYMATLDAAAFGAASDVTPKFVSPSDPINRVAKESVLRCCSRKRILRLGRLRLRGPCAAQFEFTLAAIAQNLRRLAKQLTRPPPMVADCVA